MKNKLNHDIAVIVAILSIPFIAYSYLLLPKSSRINILTFTVTSGNFPEFQTFSWVLLQKFIFIFVFFLWYKTCRHWWKRILILPIFFFGMQFLVALNDGLVYFDEDEFFIGILIATPFIVGFIIIIKTIKKYFTIQKLKNEVEIEIETILENVSKLSETNHNSLIRQFKQLKLLKEDMDREIYLKALIKLKDSL